MNELGSGKVFIISGPSGTGKDTVSESMKGMDGYASLDLATPRSYTTRSRRSSDTENTPYIFVSAAEFDELIDTDMAEWSESYGNKYGMCKSSLEECLAKGKNVLKIMDKAGTLAFKKAYPDNVVTFYLVPPSIEELRRRLEGRGSETPEAVERRMRDNEEEMKDLSGFDHLVVSDEVDRAAKEILTTMLAVGGTRNEIVR